MRVTCDPRIEIVLVAETDAVKAETGAKNTTVVRKKAWYTIAKIRLSVTVTDARPRKKSLK